MAINFNDLTVTNYRRAPQPYSLTTVNTDVSNLKRLQDLKMYLEEEFRRIEGSISSLTYAAPQVAIDEPDQKSKGLIRYAKSPWNPLGTGDGWVYWNGSAWAAL